MDPLNWSKCHCLRRLPSLEQTRQPDMEGRATGIYIYIALPLQLTTPTGRATDAYYQELLGTAMGALMVQHNAIHAYSDCQAAIRRFRHASNTLGSSIGQLQNGPSLMALGS